MYNKNINQILFLSIKKTIIQNQIIAEDILIKYQLEKFSYYDLVHLI